MSNTFTIGSNLKKWMLGLMVAGLLFGVGGSLLFDHTGHMGRFWSNLLLNTYYFAGIAVTGVFIVAAHQLGYGGWHTVFKKIPIAMGRFLLVTFALFVVIVLGMWLMPSGLYNHWADSQHIDSIIQGKSPFLTKTWYTIGVLGFFGLWALFASLLNKKFKAIHNWKEYSSAKKISAAFLLVFGVSSSMLSWWVIMSLDPHWYSTLFGWYNLASYVCAGLAMMILLLIALSRTGLMPNVHIDHIHDLGKLMFGFSVFWTYLWFSQFMLIWYANVPEATVWFNKRFDVPLFKGIFFVALLINFVLPLLVLMKRDSKRKIHTMIFVSVMLIFGHYLDFYQMVMFEPNAISEHGEHGAEEAHGEEHAANGTHYLYAQNEAIEAAAQAEQVITAEEEVMESHESVVEEHPVVSDTHAEEVHTETVHAEDAHGEEAHGEHAAAPKTHARLGLVELFFFLGFLGAFLFVTLSSLAGENLEVTEDPFLKESLHHHI